MATAAPIQLSVSVAMAQQPRALLLDCLGTLVRLEPPAPRLAAALGIGLEDAERRMAEEIAFYRANMHAAVDAPSLAALRERCAALAGCDVPTLMEALVFTPYPDAVPALERWRAQGRRLVVVSNWDVSLHEVLARTGLDVCLDGAVSSAEVGAAKPDPRPVRAALALAGTDDAWLVGDDVAADAGAAAAAGLRFVHVDRPRTDLRGVLP